MASRTILPRAILFDMDGTLTRPMLDFPRIKAEMGIGDRPILETLSTMPADERARAEQILLKHEEMAAAGSTLNPGCRELLGWLARRGIAAAVVTRNSRESLRTVLLRHGLDFEIQITREDARPKPDPSPLHLACERLQTTVEHVWMVGDGRYDIEAGLAARVKTVWLSHGRTKYFPSEPWRIVTDLPELHRLLESLVGLSSSRETQS